MSQQKLLLRERLTVAYYYALITLAIVYYGGRFAP